jgi:phosphoribosylglycinamide formyltransferase-1
MGRVVVLTSDELRHRFVRMVLALDERLDVVRSYCEAPQDGLAATLARRTDVDRIELEHLEARERSEHDFFGALCAAAPDLSDPVHLQRGAVNDPAVFAELDRLDPDVIAAFGCSLIGRPLIDRFRGRIVNLHLGLSPYYRGSGTNFMALVDRRPELVGATFMHLDEGIDTGEVIHQVRAQLAPADTPHQIFNRLIRDAALAYGSVLANLDRLRPVEQVSGVTERVCRRRDADPSATRTLYEHFRGGMVEQHLAEREQRVRLAPIVEHPVLVADLAARAERTAPR